MAVHRLRLSSNFHIIPAFLSFRYKGQCNIYITVVTIMYTMIQKYSVYRTLKAFMDYPLIGFGIRDLCRRVKLGPPSIINNLKKLKDDEFVVEKKVYGRKLYFANRESRLFRL